MNAHTNIRPSQRTLPPRSRGISASEHASFDRLVANFWEARAMLEAAETDRAMNKANARAWEIADVIAGRIPSTISEFAEMFRITMNCANGGSLPDGLAKALSEGVKQLESAEKRTTHSPDRAEFTEALREFCKAEKAAQPISGQPRGDDETSALATAMLHAEDRLLWQRAPDLAALADKIAVVCTDLRTGDEIREHLLADVRHLQGVIPAAKEQANA